MMVVMADTVMEGIGPHEGIELELMLAGTKPLAMFTEVSPLETGVVPEEDFRPHVESGRIIMREVFEPAPKLPNYNGDVRTRRVLYALPEEAWRIEAMLLLCQVYETQGGWDVGLERMTGRLLGYEERQIEAFLKRLASGGSNAQF
jgi:hypothetical protein